MESVGGRLGVCELATCASIGIKNPSAKQVFIVRGTTEGRAQGVMSDIAIYHQQAWIIAP